MLPQRVTIGTVEEIRKTTKTINLKKAGGRGRIKCPGNAPTLLYQSNNSSNDLCYLLSHSFPAQDDFLQPTQLSVSLSKNTEQPIVCDFLFFFLYIKVMTLALIHMEPFLHSQGELFILKTNVGWCSRCYSVFQLVSPALNVGLIRGTLSVIGEAVLNMAGGFSHCFWLCRIIYFQFNFKIRPPLSASLHSLRSHCPLCGG